MLEALVLVIVLTTVLVEWAWLGVVLVGSDPSCGNQHEPLVVGVLVAISAGLAALTVRALDIPFSAESVAAAL